MDAKQDNPDVVPTKVVDYLGQDPVIRGQRYACISFVSPEDVLARKDVFAFHKFMQGVSNDIDLLLTNIKSKFGDTPDVQETVQLLRERYAYLWSPDQCQEEYRSFVGTNGPVLDDDFRALSGSFQTSVRGFKIRGVYDTVDEARSRAQAIKRFDNNFHVYISEVGCWCPWSPDPNLLNDTEYTETQLNTLMKKYQESQEHRSEFYEARKKDMMKRIEEHNQFWTQKVVDATPGKADENGDGTDEKTDGTAVAAGCCDASSANDDVNGEDAAGYERLPTSPVASDIEDEDKKE